MSKPIEDSPHWAVYIRYMIQFAEDVLSYTRGFDQDNFIKDARTYDASLRKIELIGLAASHIPKYVNEAHPHIEWSQIVGTRNVLAHNLHGIDNDIIWHIVQINIPTLIPQLQKLLEDAQPNRP